MKTQTEEQIKVTYICKLPFEGSINTRLINGFAEYSGDEVRTQYIENGSQVTEINFINQLTFQEYNEKNGGNLKEVTEEELDELWKEYRNGLITEFSEIKEERYFDLLECLPPQRWHSCEGVEIFFISEAYTDDLHTCCGAYKGKYFTGLQPIREDSKKLAELIKKAFNNL